MNVVKIAMASIICTSPKVSTVSSGDAGITFGGGGSDADHSRSYDEWDEEE